MRKNKFKDAKNELKVIANRVILFIVLKTTYKKVSFATKTEKKFKKILDFKREVRYNNELGFGP